MDPLLPTPRRSRVGIVTPAQIVALGLVAASVGWAAWLLQERPTADEVALLEDTTLTAPQLAAVEAALDRAKLTDYRTAEGTVWVPRSRQGAYKRAVVDADAIPKPWGTRFHEAIASGGVWTSTSARTVSLKVALQDELSQVLCSMPGIDRAAVLYDVEERSGFQQEALKTASVGIRTSPGTELDAVRAHGIRVLVASSIAGLDPDQVAVTDLATGRVFAGALEDPAASATVAPELARRFAHETCLAGKIRQALGFVRGVIVDVAIDTAPRSPETVTPAPADPSAPHVAAAANAPAELLPPAPSAARTPVAPGPPTGQNRLPDTGLEIPGIVHVTVSIPDSYLAAAIEASKGRRRRTAPAASDPSLDADTEAEQREIERLREMVGRSLPSLVSPERLRVLVTSYPTTAPDVAERRSSAGEGLPAESANRAPGVEDPLPADGGHRSSSPAVPPLPREVWLAATSVLVGLLAGFLWWAGSRDGGIAEPPHADWKGLAADDRADDERRLAA
ncbi:MAG: hypothetical protein DWI05_04400 [Planctomycetota bacterium]|nr:MAG: hypothetical protein DWI05_04400 [Planctomycetota bacterium]